MAVPQISQNERKVLYLAILGDGNVGKTAILRHYKGLKFDPGYKMTIGADFVIKRLTKGKYDLTLQIFDVGGQDKFADLRSKYYGQSEAVVIVFDLMRRQTFENIPKWFDEVLRNNNFKLLPLMLLGNKEDLIVEKEMQVTEDEIKNYMELLQNWGRQYDPNFYVIYSETSAKNGTNIHASFDKLLDKVIQ